MPVPRPATLHDLLVGWQAGEIGYREAMRRARIDTLDELYEAARLSGVELSTDLWPEEREQARIVGALLRDQLRDRVEAGP
ncbi:MAG TPA: hypothetical protein VF636_09455 [Sphingomonas sp.]|jgi:hypothetical protein